MSSLRRRPSRQNQLKFECPPTSAWLDLALADTEKAHLGKLTSEDAEQNPIHLRITKSDDSDASGLG